MLTATKKYECIIINSLLHLIKTFPHTSCFLLKMCVCPHVRVWSRNIGFIMRVSRFKSQMPFEFSSYNLGSINFMGFHIWWESHFVTNSTLIFYEKSTVDNVEIIIYGKLKWQQNTPTLIHFIVNYKLRF